MIPWEKHCLDNAEYFTAIRGRKPSDRIRKVFNTLDDAVLYANNNFDDGRTMIYAVTATGSHAHLQNA